jgi:nucleoid-associated protein YgaU
MSKDFRIGLIAGLVLAGATLLWVATRPGLAPQAAEARDFSSLKQRVQSPVATSPPVVESSAERDPPPIHAASLAGPPIPARPDPVLTNPNARSETPDPAWGRYDLTVHESAEPIKTVKFHIVRKGETLSHIAQQYYGSKEQWRKIVAANVKTIPDANKIAPGTKLILPE